jgi:serine/threonine-protein phosphatase 2A catalytic subunit
LFGEDITKQFNHRNGLDFIARGHQIAMGGYNWSHEKQCVTIFSAANYTYRCSNDAAVMELDENMRHDMLVFF